MSNAKRTAARAKTGRVVAPAVDLQRFFDGFKLPGVDVKAIVEGQRADIRAVAQANRRASNGMKVLVRREAELLREAAAEWRAAVKELGAMDGGDFAARRTELAGRVVAQALYNVRRLAEAVASSQAEACGAMRARRHPGLAHKDAATQPGFRSSNPPRRQAA